ncbi:hypothetical protein BRE01_46180 [Brevibacillus reuszeri]|uniref:Uncharacterized protein n=1 Tax=Brevibacillus reuszeri TaxID=54915 RepID=A0A0K9YLD8_9BACL|nr:hypothetical protein [Brevibacillus reuszeri]KNB69471.1 hypothetical protein ADS79_26690 [Brevibacillus reuszeri]MED1861548.1 hypothetical protein [Brevibacillus reuszeri]GED70916.1 hypothetical protein BRE01_46180 [Brevibacillus reuszeri]
MPRQRRYYREERRRPVYRDEEEWEDDDDEPEDLDRTVSKVSWGMLAVLSFGVMLSIAHSLYTPAAPLSSNDRYRVVSVSRGRLHAEEVGTGKRVSFDDQKLVKAALDGSIKRGDVIRR